MTKNEFLNQLQEKLSLISEEEKKDILLEYGSYIDDKVADGATEEEAIQGFGEIDQLAKDILEAYKINTETNHSKTDATLDKAYVRAESFFNKAGNYSLNDIFHLLFDAVVLILLLFIGRILIVDILLNIFVHAVWWLFGFTIFGFIGYDFESLFLGLFRIIYFIGAILFFVVIMSRRIKRARNHDFRVNVVEDLKQSFTREAKDFLHDQTDLPPIPNQKETKLYHERVHSSSDIGHLAVKILLVLISIPTICSIIAFGAGLIALFFLGILEQVYSIGLIMILTGLLTGSLCIQWFWIYLWPKKEGVPHA